MAALGVFRWYLCKVRPPFRVAKLTDNLMNYALWFINVEFL